MNYLQEWEKSCVDQQLIQLNVTTLEGDRPYEYLFYSEDIPRRNDGRVRSHILKRYQHVEEGGWWCSGVDVLTGEEDLWGCFKPDNPRRTSDCRKVIKYEHPPKTTTGVFALRVTQPIWEKIAQRYKMEISPEDIDPQQPDLGFWKWLIQHPSVPLCITEGAKKAGALLTAGYATIALPGINNGYRVPKDELGRRIGKSHLIPQLRKLAMSGREIYIVFDQDTKPNTVRAVNGAIRRLGYLFSQRDCTVKVVTWNPELGKGVDDLIAKGGQRDFDRAYKKAQSLEVWKAKSLKRLTYSLNVQLNCQYLPNLEIPENAQLIGIKSPKGTGKTQFLGEIVAKAIRNPHPEWVLVIGHRVRLVEALCQRFGLNYVTEVKDSETGSIFGYGLCLDSLHPFSQARFDARNWSDGIVIIDEVEQVLWHGLNSSTCSKNRVAILKSLKTLMQNVLGGNGQVFVADADLSDTALDYLISLAGVHVDPYIIKNEWQPSPENAWKVHHYPETTPRKLVQALEKHIEEGGKPFICLSAQQLKSQWGTCTLEAYLQKKFPHRKILRLDSESLVDPSHPAYGCMQRLDEVLAQYDIVLASPVIETGVSIDLRGHFTSVWAIAQGIQGENTVRQGLSRVRESVPRHLWVASYGFNQVGNGATSLSNLLASGHRLTQLNMRLLQQADFEGIDDLDTGFQAESLICWAKMAVRLNVSMINYRESVLAGLQEEGHQIVTVSSQGKQKKSLPKIDDPLTAAITEVRDRNYQAECKAIAFVPTISAQEYQVLKKRLVKTPQERRSLRKHELMTRYSLPVTSKLVIKDDRGWYPKIRLHYFLTLGRPYLAERDAAVARRLVEEGQGSLFLPDFNRSQLGSIIGVMDVLGIPILLKDEMRELTNIDADLKAMAAIALDNRMEIKTAVGITIPKNAKPITILRRFLDKIDYTLQSLGTQRRHKKRVHVYQVVNPLDDREEVFKQWLASDRDAFGIIQGEYSRLPASKWRG